MDKLVIVHRYKGYHQTPFLWEGCLEGLQIFTPTEYTPPFNTKHLSMLQPRLGKLMEHFVLLDLQASEHTHLISSNVQIFNGKTTIGELDCLLIQAGIPIHLEIVFKFYLYDPALPQELHRWIGPNRNDTLIFKLKKLKEKQLHKSRLHHGILPETA